MKLKICGCALSGGTYTLNSGQTFSAQINPSSFTQSRSISYVNEPKTPGTIGVPLKFVDFEAEEVNFDLILDGTGVIPASTTPVDSVEAQVKNLLNVVYCYNGKDHEPNHVEITWGTFIFHGRMTKMSTNYTFFDSEGQPLRAKVSLAFRGSTSAKEQQLVMNKSSPDLSHVIEVRECDTLPLLCERVYGDSRYYSDVARFNGLQSFRRLVPGMKLHFPPLE